MATLDSVSSAPGASRCRRRGRVSWRRLGTPQLAARRAAAGTAGARCNGQRVQLPWPVALSLAAAGPQPAPLRSCTTDSQLDGRSDADVCLSLTVGPLAVARRSLCTLAALPFVLRSAHNALPLAIRLRLGILVAVVVQRDATHSLAVQPPPALLHRNACLPVVRRPPRCCRPRQTYRGSTTSSCTTTTTTTSTTTSSSRAR